MKPFGKSSICIPNTKLSVAKATRTTQRLEQTTQATQSTSCVTLPISKMPNRKASNCIKCNIWKWTEKWLTLTNICLSKCSKVNCCVYQHRFSARVESGVHILELALELLPKHELVFAWLVSVKAWSNESSCLWSSRNLVGFEMRTWGNLHGLSNYKIVEGLNTCPDILQLSTSQYASKCQ
jgi:hypothetical protein